MTMRANVACFRSAAMIASAVAVFTALQLSCIQVFADESASASVKETDTGSAKKAEDKSADAAGKKEAAESNDKSAGKSGEKSDDKSAEKSNGKPDKEEASAGSATEKQKTESGEEQKETSEETPPPAAPKAMTPADRPKPAGFDAALKLYNAKKWQLAQKAFEQLIKAGTADVNTHWCLAYCYYYQRIYSRAQNEFNWVAKYSTKDVGKQRSAEATAHLLQCYRSGVCPGNCLKASDSRWYRKADGSMWCRFNGRNGWQEFSTGHIGQVINYVNGEYVHGGACPVCGGAGSVPVLKDGMAAPNQY